LETSEINSLIAFVESGRTKRLVLVGDYVGECPSGWSCLNHRLNDIADSLGVDSRFIESGSGSIYDAAIDIGKLCDVTGGHYLADGVTKLWDAAVSTFQTVGAQAEPLAWIYQAPTLPWILEEDTDDAGSRILIQDSSMMLSQYNGDADTIPDKNFKFIHNLCSIFPE